MKRTVTLLFAMLFSFVGLKGHAQSFDGGLTLGPVVSQINGDGYAGFHQLGLTAGIFGRIPSSGASSWQMELKYSLYGAHSDIKESPEMNIRLHYVELPLMYRYNLSPILINGRHLDFITLEAGLSFDFLIKGTQSANYENGVENPAWLLFSITGNAGIQFDINDRFGFNIRSLNSVTPCRFKPQVGSLFLHYYNIVMQATVTYTFIHTGLGF